MTINHRLRPLALALTLTLSLMGCADKSPESHIEEAKLALKKSDYKAAVLELKSALQSAPANAEARLLLGQTFQSLGQWANSEKELRKAMELGVQAERGLPLLAKALVRMGKFQEVIALEIPKAGLAAQAFASLHAQRANAYLGLRKPSEADKAIKAGESALANLRMGDVSTDLQLAKARVAFDSGHHTEALALLDKALAKDSKFIEAIYIKAQILLQENRAPEAIQAYQQIVAHDPQQFEAYLALAFQYLKNNDPVAADKMVQNAEKSTPSSPVVHYARAVVALRQGNLKTANDAILQVLRVTPDNLPSLMIGSATSYGLGKYEQSRKHAEYILARQPDNFSAAQILAGSQLRLNDPKAALGTLEPLLKSHANNPALLSMAGEAWLRLKDHSRAMSYLEQAARLSPSDASIKGQQVRGHLAMGQTELAIADLEAISRSSKGPSQAELLLVLLQLRRHEYDQALKSVAELEKKLPANPLPLHLRAAAYIAKKDDAAARKSLERALALDPKFYPAAETLALLDLKDKNPQAARKRFETLLTHDPKNAKAMQAIAVIALTNRQDSEYVDWMEKAIKADSNNLLPTQRLIAYFLEKKNNAKALELAKEGLARNADSVAAMMLLGTTQMAAADYQAALDSFKRMTERFPQSAQAFYQLALAQAALKQRDAARTSLQQALQLQPDFPQARAALTRNELATGKGDSALAAARQMQSLSPHDAAGFDQEGDIHLVYKRNTQAIKAYKEALERAPGARALIKLHRAMLRSGDANAADQLLAGWVRQYPKDVVSRSYIAQFYLSKGRNSDAIAQYEELQRSAPSDVTVLNNLATLYQRIKDKRALTTAEQALKLAPEQSAILDTAGWILLEHGQSPRAAELLRKAVGKTPDIPTIRYHYAAALAQSGKRAEAKKELQAAIASGQKFRELEEAKALLGRL